MSPSAVGYALRGEDKLKAATRERVRAVAEAMGYVPNRAAAALATQRHKRGRVDGLPVAFVTRGLAERGAHDAELFHSRAFFARLGYRLEHVDLAADGKGDAARFRGLKHRGFVGLLLGRVGLPRVRLEVPWDEFTVVGLTGAYHDVPIPRVQLDVAGYVREAWRIAFERGYRRIGAIVAQHEHELPDDDLRLGAAVMAQRRRPAGNIPPFTGAFDDLDGMAAWYRRHRPDVVISFPANVRYRLREEGVSIPEECGFVGLELEGGLAEQPAGDVTCFRAASRLLTDAAGRVLDFGIRHGIRGQVEVPEILFVPAPWHEGRTLPRRNPAAAAMTNDQ